MRMSQRLKLALVVLSLLASSGCMLKIPSPGGVKYNPGGLKGEDYCLQLAQRAQNVSWFNQNTGIVLGVSAVALGVMGGVIGPNEENDFWSQKHRATLITAGGGMAGTLSGIQLKRGDDATELSSASYAIWAEGGAKSDTQCAKALQAWVAGRSQTSELAKELQALAKVNEALAAEKAATEIEKKVLIEALRTDAPQVWQDLTKRFPSFLPPAQPTPTPPSPNPIP